MSMPDSIGAVASPRKRTTWLWSFLAGLAVGGAVASGIFLGLMQRQQRRHEAEIVAVTGVAAVPGKFLGDMLGMASAAPQDPLKEDIKNYLSGKTLAVPEGQALRLEQGETSKKSCIIKKEGIELLETLGGSSVNGGPWNSGFTMLYDDGANGRYAVEGTVEYRRAGQRAIFFGYTVSRVAKQ